MPGARSRGRGARSTARTSTTSTRSTCAGASAWCSSGPTSSPPCRSATTSWPGLRLNRVRAGLRGDRRAHAAPDGAVGRSEGPPRRQRRRPVGRPAAAPVHRARAGGRAGGAADGRAGLGARSHRHRQDRGADRRAQRGLHDRHRHAQHAAGGPRLRLHRVLLPRRAHRARRHPAGLHATGQARRPKTTSPGSSGRSAGGRRDIRAASSSASCATCATSCWPWAVAPSSRSAAPSGARQARRGARRRR